MAGSSKIAFIYTGQGSQFSGMAKKISYLPLWERYSNRANEILGIDLEKIMNGDEKVLTETQNAQPALYLFEYVITKELENRGFYPDVVAGHSLGEYSAVATSGVFSFGEGLYLVRKRGLAMTNTKIKKGAMAAIKNVTKKSLEEKIKDYDGVYISNDNAKKQKVVSGKEESILELIKKYTTEGKFAVKLKVSTAFHTLYMRPAQDELAYLLKNMTFKEPKYPIVMNFTGKFTKDLRKIKHNLIKQTTNRVLWLQSVKHMKKMGITDFIEIGPKKHLTKMLIKDGYNKKGCNIHFWEDIIKEKKIDYVN